MKSLVLRLRSWATIHHRWFALGAVFSLFSLFTIFTGNEAWLGCLAPADAQRTPESAA